MSGQDFANEGCSGRRSVRPDRSSGLSGCSLDPGRPHLPVFDRYLRNIPAVATWSEFPDAVILGAYACLGVVFAAPSAASPFDGRPTIWKAGARVVISVFYGELLAVTMLLLGIITVYVSNGGRIVVGPNLQSLSE